MADTSVKFFASDMLGAPTLSGTAGSLIAVLDACLINGFSSGNVDSVVIASGVATVTRSAGHPFETDMVALIAGATTTGASINGEQKVLSKTATTYTFACPGVPDQTATGVITHKVAPLAWTKEYSSTNKAAYKSSDVTSTGCLLRVDDTGTTSARVVAFESMTTVDTGTGQFPSTIQISGGLYWPKSSAADATTRQWIVVGDSRLFFIMTCHTVGTQPNNFSLFGVFGDINSVRTPDAYGCIINGLASGSLTTAGNSSAELDHGDATSPGAGFYICRFYTTLGGSMPCRKTYPVIAGTNDGVRSGVAGLAYPNYADGGLYISPHYVVEDTSGVYRGVTPGFYPCIQLVGKTVFQTRDRVTGITSLPGRTLTAVNSFLGPFFFDITGPWR